MYKMIAIILSCAMLLTACSVKEAGSPTDSPENAVETSANVSVAVQQDKHSEEYISSLGFTSLSDQKLTEYVENTVYSDLTEQLDNKAYRIEDVQATYVSKEYLEELAYNSRENVYFGYSLSELDQAFQGRKYVFTLGDDGQTTVKPVENAGESFDKVARTVAIGAGVILLSVTVVILASNTPVRTILAASAKTAQKFAKSTGVLSEFSGELTKKVGEYIVDEVKDAALEQAVQAVSLLFTNEQAENTDFRYGVMSGIGQPI